MSETAERADVVLPGAVWCEDEGTTTNLEGRVVKINARRSRPARPAATGRSCPIWRAGWAAGSSSRTRRAREIWDELRVASHGRRLRLLRHHLGEDRRAGRRLLALPHRGPSRHAAPLHRALRAPGRPGALFAIRYQPPAEEPSDDFPFRLTTGRVVYHYLSGTQTRRLGFLNAAGPRAWVEIHPQAAARLGIANDEIVRVRTPRGSMELKALVVPTIRPDTLFIPFHYGHARPSTS